MKMDFIVIHIIDLRILVGILYCEKLEQNIFIKE